MLLTPHTVAGIVIGAAVANPVIAVPAAFFSHFLLDFVPHWDDLGLGKALEHSQHLSARSFRVVALDALISLSLVLLFLYWAMPDYGIAATILACVVAANLPDAFYIPLVILRKRWGWSMWMTEIQKKIQAKSRAPLLLGSLTQLLVVVVGLLVARQEILIRLPQIWRIL